MVRRYSTIIKHHQFTTNHHGQFLLIWKISIRYHDYGKQINIMTIVFYHPLWNHPEKKKHVIVYSWLLSTTIKHHCLLPWWLISTMHQPSLPLWISHCLSTRKSSWSILNHYIVWTINFSWQLFPVDIPMYIYIYAIYTPMHFFIHIPIYIYLYIQTHVSQCFNFYLCIFKQMRVYDTVQHKYIHSTKLG